MTTEADVILDLVATIAARDGSDPLQVLLEIVYKARRHSNHDEVTRAVNDEG